MCTALAPTAQIHSDCDSLFRTVVWFKSRRKGKRFLQAQSLLLLSALFARVLWLVQLDQSPTVQVLHTDSGVRFGLLGEKRRIPSPTLFIFATDLKSSLTNPSFAKIGHILAKEGYLCVSLDLPSHGEDIRTNEPEGLDGWRARLTNSDDFLPGYLARVSEVLDHLIHTGFADPARIAACGTSRGGFIALHVTAIEPRIKCVAAFAPVTDLLALKEFHGTSDNRLIKNQAVVTRAENLVGKAVWITIGNNDHRVNTDDAITMARGVVRAAVAQGKTAQIQLHLMPSDGHRTPANAHEDAARWLLSILGSGGSGETSVGEGN